MISLDPYIIDSLMPDLVGHDRMPSAFLVYLYLLRHGRAGRAVTASLSRIATDTGLAKSSVQSAMRNLKRRKLVRSRSASQTAVPEYVVLKPWVRHA